MIEAHWDSLVHLAASVSSGHASAVSTLARVRLGRQGDPIYDAGVQVGKLLRARHSQPTSSSIEAFRRELRRVLNRGGNSQCTETGDLLPAASV